MQPAAWDCEVDGTSPPEKAADKINSESQEKTDDLSVLIPQTSRASATARVFYFTKEKHPNFRPGAF